MPGVVPELRGRIPGLEAAASAAPGAAAPQPPRDQPLQHCAPQPEPGCSFSPKHLKQQETAAATNARFRCRWRVPTAAGLSRIATPRNAAETPFPAAAPPWVPPCSEGTPATSTPPFLLCSPSRRPAAAEPGPPRGCANPAGSRPEPPPPPRRCRAPAPQRRGLTGSSALAGAQLVAGAHGLGEELLTAGRPAPLPSANC